MTRTRIKSINLKTKMRWNNKTGNERVTKDLKILCFGFILVALLSSYSLGLELNVSNSSYEIEENETLEISIKAYNVSGNVSFSENSEFANITKINNTNANLTFLVEDFCEKGTNKKNYVVEITGKDDNSTDKKDVNITVNRINDELSIEKVYYNQEIYSKETTINISFSQVNAPYECKYDFSNKSFEDMRFGFVEKNETLYKARLGELSQGSYSMFIRCIDECGNYMEEPSKVDFEVNLPPSASISLHPKPPLKEGRVEVELSASEPLSSAPELTYVFDNDKTPKPVYLVGEGRFWEGYLVIREDDIEKIGSFNFKGRDLTGLEGKEIESGEIFLVDTIAPERIESLRVENQQTRVRLVWNYGDGDDIDEYKIYRREGSGGTGLIDYYDSTSKTYFYDEDVEYNKAYYYRVSAVDEAGNEGELSKEVFITFRPEEQKEEAEEEGEKEEEETEKEEKLKPTLRTELDGMLSQMDKWLLDIKGKIEEFQRIKEEDKIRVLENFNIIAKLKGAEQRISDLRKEMRKLENQSLSEDEFDRVTKAALEEAENAWASCSKHISIDDAEKYEEEINDEKTSLVFREYLSEKGIEENEDIISQVEKAQDDITVKSQILEITIGTFGNESRNYLMVDKEISASRTISEAIILEWLPPNLEAKMEGLTLLSNGEEVVKNNLYSWNKNKLTSIRIAYYIEGEIKPIELKETKTIVFNNELLKIITKKDNPITGASMKETKEEGEKEEGFHPLFIPMIVAMVIAAALLSYYIFMVSKEGYTSKIKRYEKSDDRRESDRKLKIKDLEEEKGERKKEEEYHKMIENYSTYIKANKHTFDRGDIMIKINEEHPIISIYSYLAEYKDKLKDKDEVGLNESETIKEHAKKIQSLCKEILAINTEKHAETTKRYILKALKQIEENNESKYRKEKERKSKLGLDKRKLLVKKGIAGKKEKELQDKKEKEKGERKRESQEEKSREEEMKHRDIKAPEGKEFRLANGDIIRSISELIDKLEQMNDEIFFQHVREDNNSGVRNDFAVWLRDVFGMEDSFQELNKAKDRTAFLDKVKERF